MTYEHLLIAFGPRAGRAAIDYAIDTGDCLFCSMDENPDEHERSCPLFGMKNSEVGHSISAQVGRSGPVSPVSGGRPDVDRPTPNKTGRSCYTVTCGGCGEKISLDLDSPGCRRCNT